MRSSYIADKGVLIGVCMPESYSLFPMLLNTSMVSHFIRKVAVE